MLPFIRPLFALLLLVNAPSLAQPFSLQDTTFKAGAVYRCHFRFDFDQAKLSGAAITALDSICVLMKARPELKFEIGVHASTPCNPSYSKHLCLTRARTIYRYMIQNGIASDRLTGKDYCVSRPLYSNAQINCLNTPAEKCVAKRANQRVEFIILALQ